MFGVLLDHLQMIVQGLNVRDAPVLLLAIYQVVTGSCVFTNQAKEVTVSNKCVFIVNLVINSYVS